MELAGSFR